MRSCSVVGRAEVAWEQFRCKMMRHFASSSFKHNFFMYVCEYFIFFSSAWFAQQHPLTRQLRWPLWAILRWCEVAATVLWPWGRKLGLVSFHIHQPQISHRLLKPAPWGHKWWIKQLLCDLFWGTCSPSPSLKNYKKIPPCRLVKVPSCPGKALVSLVRGHCRVPATAYLHMC